LAEKIGFLGVHHITPKKYSALKDCWPAELEILAFRT
jgi:hypothetical protein